MAWSMSTTPMRIACSSDAAVAHAAIAASARTGSHFENFCKARYLRPDRSMCRSAGDRVPLDAGGPARGSEVAAPHRELEDRRLLHGQLVQREAEHHPQRSERREPLDPKAGTVAPVGDVEQVLVLREGVPGVEEDQALEPERHRDREAVLDRGRDE